MFVSLQFRLELKKEDKEELIQLMRKQSSTIRVAYRRLLIDLVQSPQGEPSGCEGDNGRDSAWQVLRIALPFPILGKVLPRDLSPLKPILVEGMWEASQ